MNQQCPLGHNALVIGYCFNPRCSERLACPQCILDVHRTHRGECYLFDEVKEHIDRLIIKYESINIEQLKEQAEQTCSDLITQFSKIISDMKHQLKDAYTKTEDQVQIILEILELFKNNKIDFKLAFSALDTQRMENIKSEILQLQSIHIQSFKSKVCDLQPEFNNKLCELIELIKQEDLKQYFLNNMITEIPEQYKHIKGEKINEIKKFECMRKHYYGEMEQGLLHGFGTLVDPNVPYILQGIWEKGQCKFGAGYYIINNLSAMYLSPYEQFQANGKGIWKSSNGDVYEGDLVNNARTGKGVYKFHNGHVYIGEFKDNLHHGAGVYHFKDGSKIKGTWVEHKKEGEFEIYQPFEDVVWQRVTFHQNKLIDPQ